MKDTRVTVSSTGVHSAVFTILRRSLKALW